MDDIVVEYIEMAITGMYYEIIYKLNDRIHKFKLSAFDYMQRLGEPGMSGRLIADIHDKLLEELVVQVIDGRLEEMPQDLMRRIKLKNITHEGTSGWKV